MRAARSRAGAIELKLDDYEALGGLRGALAAHGREILDELLPEHRAGRRAVFRALTAGSSLAEAVRRPTELRRAGGDRRRRRDRRARGGRGFPRTRRNFLVPSEPDARSRPTPSSTSATRA